MTLFYFLAANTVSVVSGNLRLFYGIDASTATYPRPRWALTLVGGRATHAIKTRSFALHFSIAHVRTTMPNRGRAPQPFKKGSTEADQHGGRGGLLNFFKKKERPKPAGSRQAQRYQQGSLSILPQTITIDTSGFGICLDRYCTGSVKGGCSI